MKKLILIFTILVIVLVHETISDEQKFKVTFSISFDEMTLSQAAEIEKNIRSKFEKNKGCVIDVSLSNNKPVQGIMIPQDWQSSSNGINVLPAPGMFNLDSTYFKSFGK